MGIDALVALQNILAEQYGLSGNLLPITGERDRNFELRLGDGSKMVVKVAAKDEAFGEIECQMAALDFLADSTLANILPLPVKTRNGALILASDLGSIRVLRYLEGQLLAAVSIKPDTGRSIGLRLAQLTAAMEDFDHPGARRHLLWDVMQSQPVARLAEQIADRQLRKDVCCLIERFTQATESALDTVRWQVLHNDFNPHNLICDDNGRICGIIDFGDMTYTTRVADLAIALSYHFSVDDDPLRHVAKILAGYVGVAPLNAAEIALLVPAIGMRVAATLAITEWSAHRFPERASYLRRNVPSAKTALTNLMTDRPNSLTDRIMDQARQETAKCSV